jgi:hypothetical protein
MLWNPVSQNSLPCKSASHNFVHLVEEELDTLPDLPKRAKKGWQNSSFNKMQKNESHEM